MIKLSFQLWSIFIQQVYILSQYMKFIRRSAARTFKASSFSIAFRKRATTPFLVFGPALSMQFAEVY